MPVPVKTTGISEGVKAGGKLMIDSRRVTVKALMENIPEFYVVDITELQIGDAIRVRDLEVENLEFVDATDIYGCDDLLTAKSLELINGIFTVKDTCMLGDVNGDGIINSADAAMTLELASKKIANPDDCQKIAGDVSGDGRILANDAALIMRLAAGLSLTPDAPIARRMNLRASPVNLSLPQDVSVFTGDSIEIPVQISSAANLASAEVVLNYDSDLLTVESVIKSSLTENFTLDFNVLNPGQLKVGIAAGQELSSGSEELFKVKFTAKNISGNKVSPLTLASAHLYDSFGRDFATSALQRDVTLTDGKLTVKDIDKVSLSDLILVLKVLTGFDVDTSASNADADNNGTVELQDAIHLLQIVANLKK